MKNKVLTVIVILAVASFIYYNKSSFLEKQRTRRDLENRLEEFVGRHVDLKPFFKEVERVNDRIEDEGEDKLNDLKEDLSRLTKDELESLADLLDHRGDDLETLFQDLVDDIGSEGEGR